MSAYARIAVTRDGTGWTVSGNDATLAADATFPTVAAGSATVTHAGLGTASAGNGNLILFGAVSNQITIAPGAIPIVKAGSKFSNSNSDAMTTAAATLFLDHLLNNTNWANVGDATGLLASGADGNLYLSLHTASPGQTGNQATSEVSYT